MSQESEKFIVLLPGDVDMSRILIKDPETITFKSGTSSTSSNAFYLNDDGEEVALCIHAPEQSTFGAGYKYDMNFKPDKGEQYPDKAKGLQVYYPMTSMDTIKKPAPQEAAFTKLVTDLWALGVKQGEVEASREPLLIPAVSESSYASAKLKNNMRNFMKFPIQDPKIKPEDKGPRPKSMYINLITRGIGNDMRVLTKIYSTDTDDIMPEADYINVRGTMEPCIKFEGIYWGAHGKNSHGASLRFRILEANFTPSPGFSGGVPKGRLMGGSGRPRQNPEDDGAPIPPPTRVKPPVRTQPQPDPEEADVPEGDDADPINAIMKPAAKPAPKRPAPGAAPAKPPAKKQVQVKKGPPKPKPKPVEEPDDVNEDPVEDE
jgi:hypothetical protein